MNCRRVKKSLVEYSDGRLPESDAEAVRSHLDECPGCRTLAGKAGLSGEALSSLERVPMRDEASQRVLVSLRESSGEKSRPLAGFFNSRRNLAVVATVAGILVAVAIVVGLTVGRQPGQEGAGTAQRNAAETTPVSTGGESMPAMPSGVQEKAVAVAPTAVVKVTSTDYTQDSLRTMFESLPVRTAFATAFSMADAVTLGKDYSAGAAREFQNLGQDGACLESMFTYVMVGEPGLLPCYVEAARFNGQGAWILGLAGPQRSGSSPMLTRAEVWVMDPVKFQAKPDSGLLFFLEHR